MVPDRQKVWTDGMDGRTTPQLYFIPPTSSGDNYNHHIEQAGRRMDGWMDGETDRLLV